MLINPAWAQGAPAAGGGFESLILIVLMFAVLYFLMIRPQMKRAKEHKTMIEALQKGDEVVAAGGVLGRINKISDTYVTLEIANNVEIQVQRPAIRDLGIADANGEGTDDRALRGLYRARNVGGLRIDDDVHRALPVELDFARPVPRDRPESHPFQHAAHCLRPRRREFDELDAVDAERVLGFGDRFAIQWIGHSNASS